MLYLHATCYDFITMNQVIHGKCHKKSEAVAQHCSVKIFCKTSKFSQKSIYDGSPFGKNCKRKYQQLQSSPVFPVNRFCEYNFFGSFDSSIRSDMFYKVGLLKNFGKLSGKHLCQSFFC